MLRGLVIRIDIVQCLDARTVKVCVAENLYLIFLIQHKRLVQLHVRQEVSGDVYLRRSLQICPLLCREIFEKLVLLQKPGEVPEQLKILKSLQAFLGQLRQQLVLKLVVAVESEDLQALKLSQYSLE